jgi:hypothetical protein
MYTQVASPFTTGCFKNVPVRLLETRFKIRNCISEPGHQEPYRDFETPFAILVL